MYWKALTAINLFFDVPLKVTKGNELLIDNNQINVRQVDKDYLLIKDAISKAKTRDHLGAMHMMIKDFCKIHDNNQYAIYLHLDLSDKVFQVLYSNI